MWGMGGHSCTVDSSWVPRAQAGVHGFRPVKCINDQELPANGAVVVGGMRVCSAMVVTRVRANLVPPSPCILFLLSSALHAKVLLYTHSAKTSLAPHLGNNKP